MGDELLDQLKHVIESEHGGCAKYTKSWQLQNVVKKVGRWDGIVHEFDLEHNEKAHRAYAWSAPIDGSSKLRFFAALHMGRVVGPVEAVKAAATMIRNSARHV